MKKAKIYLFFLILFSIISGGVVMGNEIAVDQQIVCGGNRTYGNQQAQHHGSHQDSQQLTGDHLHKNSPLKE